MKEEELNALERDAKALRDPNDRAEALKALAELRAAQSDFELELKTAARTVPRSPDFRNFSLVKLVKLIFGAAAFLALCASLIFLVMPVGRLLEGDTSPGTLSQLSVALSAVAAFAMLLYVLGRKSQTERDALERNPIARQFARQKFMFQLSALGLLAVTVFTIVLTASALKEYRSVAALIVPLGFLFGYWLLGQKFWRCPACGHQLSFMRRHMDRQSIQSCPSCHATLQ
jgi:ribosomal protein S27AE